MNKKMDTEQGRIAADSEKTKQSIIRGLLPRQAYVLIYGLSLAGVTLGIVCAIRHMGTALLVAAFSVPFGLICATIIILKLDKENNRFAITGSADIDEHLRSLYTSVKEALDVPHSEFRRDVIQAVARLNHYLAHIRNGQVKVNEKDYNGKMHEMLASAKMSVSYVHRGDYLRDWFKRIGRNASKSLGPSAPSVTHVFVFDKLAELTGEVQKQIENLNESLGGAEIYVYFDQEDENYRFPEDFPKDYVLLDGGDAICVTDKLEKDGFSGTWYYNDERRKAMYGNEFAKLKGNSIIFKTFKATVPSHIAAGQHDNTPANDSVLTIHPRQELNGAGAL